MKVLGVMSRVGLLLLTAAALAGLTAIYGRFVQVSLPNPASQAVRRHRPSAPHLREFPEFAGEGMLLAYFAAIGRIVFRLRLSPPSRSEGQLVFLDLQPRAPRPPYDIPSNCQRSTGR